MDRNSVLKKIVETMEKLKKNTEDKEKDRSKASRKEKRKGSLNEMKIMTGLENHERKWWKKCPNPHPTKGCWKWMISLISLKQKKF